MNVTVVIPPAYEPVTLQEAWQHLRLTPSGSPLSHPDDDELAVMIAAARKDVEDITGRALIRQKVRLSAANFCRLFLLRPPLISVESVQYYDSANALQSLTGDQWYVTDEVVPQLCIVNNAWPVTYPRPDAVRVTYWAGYPSDSSPDTERLEHVANVPTKAKLATLMGMSLLYEDLTAEQKQTLMDRRRAILAGLIIPVVA